VTIKSGRFMVDEKLSDHDKRSMDGRNKVENAESFSTITRRKLASYACIFGMVDLWSIRRQMICFVGINQGKYTQVRSYKCKHASSLTSHAPTGREELHYIAMKPCDVSQLGCLHLYEHTCVYLPWSRPTYYLDLMPNDHLTNEFRSNYIIYNIALLTDYG